jgi:type VI secretion system protein ImpA
LLRPNPEKVNENMSRRLDPLLTDLDRLTAPISTENPCGAWLRYDVTYDEVRGARREDDAGLPQGVWASELKRANWATVEKLCAEALVERSKDLQLAAWLMEAWIQLDGFAGAARGFELMRGLCSAFWDQMYPALGNDLAPRLAPIQWVNEKLSRRIRLVRLTQPAMEGMPAYSLADWDLAMRNPGGAQGTDAVSIARFEQSVKLTGYPWFFALQRDVNETAINLAALDNLIDERAAKLSSGLAKFRDEVSSVARLVEAILAEAPGQPPDQVPDQDPDQDPGQAPGQDPDQTLARSRPVERALGAGHSAELALDVPSLCQAPGIRTRAEAYSLLEEIAIFLHQNDPHSPTPYLISRAVAWGNMHFDELLPELVGDAPKLSDLLKLLNIPAPQRNS